MKQGHYMKATTLFIFIVLAVTGYSQTTINNFKYVLVPGKYDFLREDNQYGLNSTTKMMLADKGFVAYMSNEQVPAEVVSNPCNALKAEVVQKKGIFVTNLTLILKDCQGNIIFKSKEGKSREKEYHTAFQEALRDAFTSLKDVPYKYDGTVITPAQAAPVPATTSPAAPAPAQAPAPAALPDMSGMLYAQPTANGFQLVDTTPKKILTLLKTSVPDYFIAEAGAANGIVFKKDGAWIFEYYKDNKLVSQKLEIKF
jgi:hypothetical protein